MPWKEGDQRLQRTSSERRNSYDFATQAPLSSKKLVENVKQSPAEDIDSMMRVLIREYKQEKDLTAQEKIKFRDAISVFNRWYIQKKNDLFVTRELDTLKYESANNNYMQRGLQILAGQDKPPKDLNIEPTPPRQKSKSDSNPELTPQDTGATAIPSHISMRETSQNVQTQEASSTAILTSMIDAMTMEPPNTSWQEYILTGSQSNLGTHDKTLQENQIQLDERLTQQIYQQESAIHTRLENTSSLPKEREIVAEPFVPEPFQEFVLNDSNKTRGQMLEQIKNQRDTTITRSKAHKNWKPNAKERHRYIMINQHLWRDLPDQEKKEQIKKLKEGWDAMSPEQQKSALQRDSTKEAAAKTSLEYRKGQTQEKIKSLQDTISKLDQSTS